MTITFSRSGGFAAAPGLRVRAVATLDGQRGRVESDRYVRDLAASETTALEAAALAAAAEPAKPAPHSPSARDAFRYEFSITFDDGRTCHISGGDETSSESAAGHLVAWARAEAARILAAAR